MKYFTELGVVFSHDVSIKAFNTTNLWLNKKNLEPTVEALLNTINQDPIAKIIFYCTCFIKKNISIKVFDNLDKNYEACRFLADHFLVELDTSSQQLKFIPILQSIVLELMSVEETIYWIKKSLLLKLEIFTYNWEMINKFANIESKKIVQDSLLFLALKKVNALVEEGNKTVVKNTDKLPTDLSLKLPISTISKLVMQVNSPVFSKKKAVKSNNINSESTEFYQSYNMQRSMK